MDWKLYRMEVVGGPYYRIEHARYEDDGHALLAAREILYTERDVLLVRPGVKQFVTVTVSTEKKPGGDLFRELGTWRIEGIKLNVAPTFTPAEPVATLAERKASRR